MDELMSEKNEEYQDLGRSEKLKYHKEEFKRKRRDNENNMDIVNDV